MCVIFTNSLNTDTPFISEQIDKRTDLFALSVFCMIAASFHKSTGDGCRRSPVFKSIDLRRKVTTGIKVRLQYIYTLLHEA